MTACKQLQSHKIRFKKSTEKLKTVKLSAVTLKHPTISPNEQNIFWTVLKKDWLLDLKYYSALKVKTSYVYSWLLLHSWCFQATNLHITRTFLHFQMTDSLERTLHHFSDEFTNSLGPSFILSAVTWTKHTLQPPLSPELLPSFYSKNSWKIQVLFPQAPILGRVARAVIHGCVCCDVQESVLTAATFHPVN